MSQRAPAMPSLHPEVRMAEMVSMGVGNKAFRDIAPNEEAISDRTINYVLKCRGSLVGGVRKAAREAMRTSISPSSLPSGPWSRWALTCPNLPLSLMQKFVLGPPLLWPRLTVRAPTWGPRVPFLQTLPLAQY